MDGLSWTSRHLLLDDWLAALATTSHRHIRWARSSPLRLGAHRIRSYRPAELFFPNAAFNLFGSSVWILILSLYLFVLLFLVLNSSLRLIVYGLTPDQLSRYVHEY